MRIGELAKATATKAVTIRYYESEGLLPSPERTTANYRDYGPEHLARLRFIRRSRELGFRLNNVRELLTLTDDTSQPCERVDQIASSHLADVERKLADLSKLRDELSRLVGSCREGSVAHCRIIESLESN